MDGNDLYLLRGVITTYTNDYFIANNTVKVTNKPRYAANYTSRQAASNAASLLCDGGDPYVVIISPFAKDTTKMQDQMYVLFTEHYGDRRYFVAATYDGPELTDDVSMAAHYLNEEAADEATRALSAFPEAFDYEPDGFWGDE